MIQLLSDLLREAVVRHADRPAVSSPSVTLTYRELAELAAGFAAELGRRGLGAGDRVGVYAPKSPELVAALYGALSLGVAYVPVDPRAPAERAAQILRHAEVGLWLGAGRPKTLLEPVGDFARNLLAIDEAPYDPDPAGVRSSRAPIDQDLAYVLYTSGSTGAPKGVAIPHRAALAFVRGAVEVFRPRPEDVFASHAPFSFDLSIIDLFVAAAGGASVYLLPETHLAFPAQLARSLEESRATVWNSVPSALAQLVDRGGLSGRSLALRLVLFAGEPYPAPGLRALRRALPGAELVNVYGQTEANSSTYFRLGAVPEDDRWVVPCGRTFPGYQVFLLDDHGQEITAADHEGELYVRSQAVAAGYLRDPDRTALAFVQNPLHRDYQDLVYRTGDRMSYSAEGELVYRGRRDTQIKVRGFRVELGEIEAVATAFAGALSAVVALPDPDVGHRLVLFVGPTQISADALTAELTRRLPAYMVPERVEIRADLPITSTGKIDRRALRELAGAGSA